MKNILVLGLTFAAILSLSFGCGCIGDAPVVEPIPIPDVWSVHIIVDGNLTDTEVFNLDMARKYIVFMQIEGVKGSWEVFLNGKLHSAGGWDVTPKPEPVPEPEPEPVPMPAPAVELTYTLLIFVDGEKTDTLYGLTLDECLEYVDEIDSYPDFGISAWDMPPGSGYFRIFAYEKNPVPAGYYSSTDTTIPNWIDTETEFAIWFESTEWVDAYEANGWDCSQMSAFMEWQLENEGFDAVIVCDTSHAWVLADIDGDGRYIALECTGRFVVWSDTDFLYPDHDYYDYDEYYEDIYAVVDFYEVDDWGWWS